MSLDNVVSSLFPTKVWKSIFGTPFVQKICCSSVGFRMPFSCCALKWATLSIKLSKSANLSSLGNLSKAFYRNIIRIFFSLKIYIFMQVQCKPSMTFWVGYIYRIYLISIPGVCIQKNIDIDAYLSQDMNLTQKRHWQSALYIHWWHYLIALCWF